MVAGNGKPASLADKPSAPSAIWNGATRMNAPSPAMVHELAGLVIAVAYLVKALWPNGWGR